MTIKYNVTGEQRKALAEVIGQAVGMEPVYMKMPTCAYAISNITLKRNGEMVWDDRTDEATIQKVTEAINAAGFTEAGEDAPEAPAQEEEQPSGLTVSLPTEQHNANSLRNLVNLLYTRAELINKALGTGFSVRRSLVDALAENEDMETVDDFCKAIAEYETENGKGIQGFSVTAEKVILSTLLDLEDADRQKTFTVLCGLMNKQALKQKRIQAKKNDEPNEKYALRIWMTRLGMGGPEYKEARRVLLENLTGHSAFHTHVQKEHWLKRQAERREEKKAAKAKEEVAPE